VNCNSYKRIGGGQGRGDVIVSKGIVAHGNDVTIASVEGVACGGAVVSVAIVHEH